MSGKIGSGETPKTEKKEGFVEKHKSKIIAGGIGAAVGAVALPIALPALGFTATGVAAGSVAAAAQSFFYGAFTTGVFSACQSMGVVGVSAGVTAIMAATGGAAAAGIATALETRKVYEAEIEKFSTHFKTDRSSVLHVKYGLKELELSKSEISKSNWTLNLSAENRYDWIVELDNGNKIQIEKLNSGNAEIQIKNFKEIRIRKIYVLKKKKFCASQSMSVVGVSAGVTGLMAAAGGAAAASIATALETRKVYEEEIEKFSSHFKTDRRSVLYLNYGLKELELSKSEISKTEWTLDISAENRFDWIVELNNGNRIQIQELNSENAEIQIKSFKEIRIRKIYVLKKIMTHNKVKKC